MMCTASPLYWCHLTFPRVSVRLSDISISELGVIPIDSEFSGECPEEKNFEKTLNNV